jgi:tRNA threonylcarbamoyladenosine biosynthesis protein TsaE
MTMTTESISLTLQDEAATDRLAAQLTPLLAALPRPALVFLHGDLGAGKTSLTRSILRALGFAGPVKSPTYALVEVYVISGLNFYHFDFYRLKDPDEWHESGFRDLFTQPAVSLVEWPEKARGAGLPLPIASLEIQLTAPDPHQPTLRHLSLAAHTAETRALLRTLSRSL